MIGISKNKSDFPAVRLISVIITVTVLVLTSAFAIMMFVLSGSIAGDSKNLDRAVLEATGAVERFKTEGLALKDTQWAAGAVAGTPEQGGLDITINYDLAWNRLPTEEGRAFSLRLVAQNTGRTIAGSMGATNYKAGEMYDLSVVVKSHHDKMVFKPLTENEIYSITTAWFEKE